LDGGEPLEEGQEEGMRRGRRRKSAGWRGGEREVGGSGWGAVMGTT
jgi:hypothetical protein